MFPGLLPKVLCTLSIDTYLKVQVKHIFTWVRIHKAGKEICKCMAELYLIVIAPACPTPMDDARDTK